MSGAFLAITVTLASSAWVEIRTGQPATDDLTYAGYPEGPGKLWIGTNAGEVYRTTDDGVTWEFVFGPRSFDNFIDLRLRTLRVPTLNLDLLRDARSDVPVRDRGGSTRRVLDLAGQARTRQRETGAQVLGAIVAQDVRDPGDVFQVAKCYDYVFITAKNGLWRGSAQAPWRFDLLPVGGDLGGGNAVWVSCDTTRPGHLVVTTPAGTMLESETFGETWHPYTVVFERNSRISFAIFFEGRIMLLAQGRIYREREDGRGFEPTCEAQVDMVEPKVSWVWNRLGPIFATGIGGVTVCDSGRVKRYQGETMALNEIYYFQTQGDIDEHVMVVTPDDIYVSHDRGKTFAHEFRRRTQSAIGLVLVDDLSTFADTTVWAGNTIWKRVEEKRGPSSGTFLAELEREAPLALVIDTALRRHQLDGGQIAARRDDARLQGLLPLVRASVAYRDGEIFTVLRDRVAVGELVSDYRVTAAAPNRDVWTVLVLWDLSDVLRSRSSTDRGWADVQRLHRNIAYNLEDTYLRWLQSQVALRDAGLSPSQRARLLLASRESAAYLDYMTEQAFPIFQR
ncbi:MAG: hypothetical protein ACAI38_08635 [Myxococcota bacterium]